MMDDPPVCQSQLPRLNSDGYKSQWIQIEQLKIHIYFTVSVRYKFTSFLKEKRGFP